LAYCSNNNFDSISKIAQTFVSINGRIVSSKIKRKKEKKNEIFLSRYAKFYTTAVIIQEKRQKNRKLNYKKMSQ
jgi:hypothetical protein